MSECADVEQLMLWGVCMLKLCDDLWTYGYVSGMNIPYCRDLSMIDDASSRFQFKIRAHKAVGIEDSHKLLVKFD